MAGKITELPAAGSLNGTELIEVVQDGVSKKAALMPYKVYTALLSQTGTAAPVATVLANTLGFTPVWSRLAQGRYAITFTSGTAPLNKRVTFISYNSDANGATATEGGTEVDDVIGLNTWSTSGTPTFQDGLMIDTEKTSFEVRIYP